MSTATKIPTFDATEWKGDAALYRLDPPFAGVVEFAIVSAINLVERRADEPELAEWDAAAGIIRDAETMIFSATSEGVVHSWEEELAVIPFQSHAAALAELGYEVAE